jgi:hypothetical protein
VVKKTLPKDDVYEQVRRADFNKTEPETLSQLVNSAIRIGDEIKGDYLRLRQLTDDVLILLKREDLLRLKQFSREELIMPSSKVASASDGSFQSMGGADGIWYVPISVALIIFDQGISSAPGVKVGAHIQKIDERQHPNLGAAMETSMLYAEASIIKDWARDCQEDIIHFIDGPVVDPPRHMEKEYVAYRADAIKGCLDKSVFVLGCVKKLLGNFLIERMTNMLRDFEIKRISQFASDAYMIYHVFTKASLQSGMAVYTKPLEISETNSIYKPYKDQGLTIYFMYFQRNPRAKPFRVDIPLKTGTQVDTEKLGEQAAATLSAWSYPGYDLPIPIVIAHDKCNIRKGCAEVLYSEIITRAASNDPFDNLVRTKLGTEVM